MDNEKDIKLQRMNDIKFLTGVGIMIILNVMLISWTPVIEIPVLIILIIWNIIQGKILKKYQLEMENIKEYNKTI